MAIQTQVWVADIAANIFPDNSFTVQSVDDSQYVDNKTVNLPQSGTKPASQRNRSTVPAQVVQRADSVETYDIEEFTTDPTLIRDIEEVEVSYDKRQDVLMDHNETLRTDVADYMAYIWAPTTAARIFDTSGVGTRPGAAPGATGTRKVFTRADVLKMKAQLDKEDIPADGRVLLLPSDFYNDLLADTTVLSSDFMGSANIPTGAIARMFGFALYLRSSAARYAAASNAPKDPVAVSAATDNAAAIAWHPRFVRRALGEIKVFANEDDATVYGSVFSALVRAGGRQRYTNGRGVVAVREVA